MKDAPIIWDVIVVGGGAAGLMAANAARKEGAHVLLVEKNSNPGQKLLLTGHGRCNLTNIRIPDNYLEAYHENARFLSGALRRFTPEDVRAFFRELGVETHEEDAGRIFPDTEKAETVLQALLKKLNSMDGRIIGNLLADDLCYDEERNLWEVKFLGKDEAGRPRRFFARSVILASGGKSFFAHASDENMPGNVYKMAEKLGHKIVPLRPALAPILLSALSRDPGRKKNEDGVDSSFAGLTITDVGTSLLVDGKKQAETRGDLLFTHQGISGPAAMELSRALPPEKDAYARGCVEFCIDLLPDVRRDALEKDLLSAMTEHPNTSIRRILSCTILHLQKAALLVWPMEDIPAHSVTKAQRAAVVERIKKLPLQVERCTPLQMAYVTRGGVDVKGIDPKTMGSKICPGLFFAGEVMDIDGISGGYNLQNAWSTGYVAGQAAAEYSAGKRAQDDAAEDDKRAE